MKKVLTFLLIMSTGLTSHAQATNCTIRNCQVPIKAECFEWCTKYVLTEGKPEQVVWYTGSVKVADTIIKSRAGRTFTKVSDLNKIISPQAIQKINQRQETLSMLAIQ